MGVLFFHQKANSLPPPRAGGAIGSEVRQGSCEWRSAIRGMPGSEFEPRCPLQSETGHPALGVLFFHQKANSLPPPRAGGAIGSEVRQGSCEWRSAIRGMPGSEFEPRCPLQSETGHPALGVLFFHQKANSLPPPRAGGAIGSEVRQGSCEWRSAIRGMPGSELEPRCPLQSETGHPALGVLFFCVGGELVPPRFCLRQNT